MTLRFEPITDAMQLREEIDQTRFRKAKKRAKNYNKLGHKLVIFTLRKILKLPEALNKLPIPNSHMSKRSYYKEHLLSFKIVVKKTTSSNISKAPIRV